VIHFCHASRGSRGALGYGRVCRYSRSLPARKRHNCTNSIAVLHGSGGTHHPQFDESRRNQLRYNAWRRITANANGYSHGTLVLVCPYGSLTGWLPFLARPPPRSTNIYPTTLLPLLMPVTRRAAPVTCGSNRAFRGVYARPPQSSFRAACWLFGYAQSLPASWVRCLDRSGAGTADSASLGTCKGCHAWFWRRSDRLSLSRPVCCRALRAGASRCSAVQSH